MDKIETRVCTKCGVEKEVTEFYRRENGLLCGHCKDCIRAKNRKWQKENPEKVKESNRKWRKKNPEKVRAYENNRRKKKPKKERAIASTWKKENPEKARDYARRWRKKNPEKVRAYERKWRKENPEKKSANSRKWQKENPEKVRTYGLYRYRKNPLRHTVSSLIYIALKGGKNGASITEILPYTIKELKDHLEKQFTDGMSWDNYGKNGWEYDHIVPTAAFTFDSPEDEQFKQWSSLKNAQPLWAADNQRKSNNIGPEWGNDKLYKEFFGKEYNEQTA